MSEGVTTPPDRRLTTAKTKWFAFGALGAAAAAFLFIAIGGIGENLVYYWRPKELRAAGSKSTGATIRLGGQVAVGSVEPGHGVSNLEVDVTDRTALVHVVSRRRPPQLVRDRIGLDAGPPAGLRLRGVHGGGEPDDGVRAADARLQRQLRRSRRVARGAHLGVDRQPLVLARRVDRLLGPGDGRLRRSCRLAQGGRAPGVHALRRRRLARLRRLLQLPPARAGAAVRDDPESAARRPRTEPALAEPLSDGDPPPVPLLGVRGHDDPVRARLRRAPRRPAGERLHPAAAQLPAHILDLPHLRDRARRLVGLRGARLWKVLGLGTRGANPVYAHSH